MHSQCICPRCGTAFYTGGPPDYYRKRYCSDACRYARRDVSERFWSKVDKNGPIPSHQPTLGACWVWGAGKQKSGYGHFHPSKHQDALAHRFAYELARGPIPSDTEVCHACDNPPCVNPSHLFLGTRSDNARDMHTKGRATQTPLRGEQNGASKLTEGIVQQIRAIVQQGEKHRVVAERFGVSRALVSFIATKRVWKHVP